MKVRGTVTDIVHSYIAEWLSSFSQLMVNNLEFGDYFSSAYIMIVNNLEFGDFFHVLTCA